MLTNPGAEASLHSLVVELVINTSRFTRLAAATSTGGRPRALVRALSLIDEYGELRITEFARLDGCSQPAATALAKKLHSLGLIDRVVDPDDSRAVRLSLSAEGRRWLADARHAIGTSLAPRLVGVDPERIEMLAAGLAELRELLKSPDSKDSV